MADPAGYDALMEQMLDYAHDPIGYARLAFRWGHGPLCASTLLNVMPGTALSTQARDNI